MATNSKIRKESGVIAYQLREIKNLGREASEENPSIAVSVVGGRTVTADELAKEIAASCTIKEADVAGVLKALSLRVQRTLLNGDRVELGEIGTLSVTLTCGDKHRADKVTSRDIKVRRIAFALKGTLPCHARCYDEERRSHAYQATQPRRGRGAPCCAF